MLGYVFWHWPRPAVSVEEYESLLRAFHEALRADAPDGFLGSACFRISGAGWIPQEHAYEDWYRVADFAALGVLNEAAVSGSRKAPHDAVARLAGGGSGGLYRLIDGEAHAAPVATWFRKPPGMSYEDLRNEISLPGALWQRQLVLGPAPEFCLQTAASPILPENFEPLEVRPVLLYG